MAAEPPGVQPFGGLLAGWRGLGRFWLAVLLVLAIGAGTLAVVGPPPEAPPKVAGPIVHADPVTVSPQIAPNPKTTGDGKVQPATKPKQQAARPGRDVPGPIADPDPSMLEPSADGSKSQLPQISMDGRVPMAVYAAGFDPSSTRPRVGLLVAGIGMSEADSLAAIKDLPGGVTLAVSPYESNINRLLEVARINEHEYLLSVPMEPQGYPVNDPDDRRALMTSLAPAENLERLRWVLARCTGYVGVTNALGSMRGERLAAVQDQFASVLVEVGHRGLLFVDARTNQKVLPYAWNRSATMAIDDDPVDATTLDQRLDALTHAALDKGSALGIVWVPRPVTLARVAAWTNTLAAKGLALAPVSALVLPPATQESGK